MRYLSVCSGIEAATCAWHPLGWNAAAFSEIETFPRAVLQHHYPDVPLHGDFTTIEGSEYGPIDLLVGGTPCQSFSVAGLRKGMADPRGNLALAFLGLLGRTRARWVVWENVPGVLSSNGGRDFGAFLGGLAELGYGWAYRILDAQYFGVPQRRRRVFVVGHLGDWRRAAAVLFERHSLSGHSPPSREAGKGVAPTIAARTRGGGGPGTDFDCDGGLIPFDTTQVTSKANYSNPKPGDPMHPLAAGAHAPAIAGPLMSKDGRGVHSDMQTFVAHTLRADGFDASEDGTGRGTPLVPIAFGWQNSAAQGDDVREETSPTLDKSKTPAVAIQAGKQHAVGLGMAVRRITPVEAERLQGFPSILKRVRVIVCQHSQDGNRDFGVNAEILSRALAAPVGSAESGVCEACVRSAERSLAPNDPSDNRRAVLSVHIDLERSALQVRSAGRLIWSASNAESTSACPLPMPIGAFARLAALTTSTLERTILDGRVGLRPNMPPSLPRWNGSGCAPLSGRVIAALASDVERFTKMVSAHLKSITSDDGKTSPNSDLSWTTSLYYAATAISGFIPREIQRASSYEIQIDTEIGYTAIPWRGKPADQCPDGPRYKALGNSMAVPVMRWIGERIAMVEEIAAEREAAA